MKLFYSVFSPFVRKVMVTARELGLDGQIETVAEAVGPLALNPIVGAANPLMKVPTLVLPSGEGLFDSRVICEYLAAQNPTPALFPAPGPARWRALRLQALADGICDAAVLARYETLRPAELQWTVFQEAQVGKAMRALDLLEQETPALSAEITIGHIAVGCALGYLDLRYADRKWRTDRPALADWFAVFGERPSMVATRAIP